MKDKSWVIILIMGIALTISIAYSVVLSHRNNDNKSTATTTSIIEMQATTATIKNTLTGTGTITYKPKEIEDEGTIGNTANVADESHTNTINAVGNANAGNTANVTDENPDSNITDSNIINNNNEIENNASETQTYTYQISLSIEDKDLEKVKLGQDTQIAINQENEPLNYLGKVTKIDKQTSTKSTINIEISNPDDKIVEGMVAFCTLIIQEADNVVALPKEAIQINNLNEEFVDVVQTDGSTKQVLIETGISDEFYVEITSGLNVGDRVQIIKSSTTVQVEDN